jgi:ketosteroid isomerase-like protein
MIGSIIIKNKARAAFAALNRRDIRAFLVDWAEDATFIYPHTVSVGGKMEGKKTIEKWFQNFLEHFPELKLTPKNICVGNICAFSGTNVIAVELEVVGRNKEGMNFQNKGVTMINTEKGKAVLVRDYIFDTEMLKKSWGEGKS